MSKGEVQHWISHDPLRHHSKLRRLVDKVNQEVDNGETLLRVVMEHELCKHLRIKERDYRSLSVFVQGYIDKNIANPICHWWDDDLTNEYSDEMFDLLYPYCLTISDYVRDHLTPTVLKSIRAGSATLHVYYTGHRNSDLRDMHLKFEWSS